MSFINRNMVPQDSQTNNNATNKRKIALITGITGQVNVKLRKENERSFRLFRMEVI